MKPTTALFPTLAVELIELIANDVEGEGLLDLRLACRELQKKTFHCFARRFFTSIKTDLSDDSLQRVDALSQHEALRPYVQGLAFMLQNGVGRGLVLDRHPWGSLSAPMEVEAIRRLRDNLTNKLTKCRSFFIFCRYPEGHPDMNRVTITDAVAVFFALIVDAQLPVSSFHLIYANKFSRTLIMDMRRLPKLLYRQPEFKVVWSNLQKLSLEQYLTLDNFGFLLELILSAPNLRTLLLNLGSHDLACEFMHELAETAIFSQLKELALFRTLVRAPDLIKILGRLRENLSTLTFYHVSLAQDDNWTSVLQELGRDFVALTSISLYYLWTNASSKEVLSFPDIQKVPMIYESSGQRLHMLYAEKPIKNPAVLGVEYSGSKVPQVLSLLQTAAIYK
ncbi:hypothetical protein N7448_009948 [Penicillium atrosanguineum]|uniref:Uncharacterized protein n=1 Tax=Penicillium atrosanguineum TaxID=1132637 RepID=A0A9W9GG52_9EURO|nr:uncharacterized protein N7443_007164 [Penicillium atrosanguineum]KAJ5118234.1 hypothetical protein N7526_009871 [Penicillium atrosanguineum]KAJ5119279.1 hypothetical protein N7448_009948 [Penicillium atrosanguineum]KAJ5296271.1 hypothetical protein N7443_007164 [Penicillium atrosanguineum]KAJ5299042.1 hypothetical protein N7476_010599 [Penicillium atrosanguineum]